MCLSRSILIRWERTREKAIHFSGHARKRAHLFLSLCSINFLEILLLTWSTSKANTTNGNLTCRKQWICSLKSKSIFFDQRRRRWRRRRRSLLHGEHLGWETKQVTCFLAVRWTTSDDGRLQSTSRSADERLEGLRRSLVSPSKLSSLHASIQHEARRSRAADQSNQSSEQCRRECLSTTIIRSFIQRRTRSIFGSCTLQSTATTTAASEQCLQFPALSLEPPGQQQRDSIRRSTLHHRSISTTEIAQFRRQRQPIEFGQYHRMVILPVHLHILYSSLF